MDTIFLGNALSRWLIAAGLILGAVVIGRLLVRVLKASAQKIGNRLLIAVLEETAGLLTLMLTLIGVRIAIESLTLPQALSLGLAQGLKFAMAIVLTWLVVGLYDALHKSVLEPYSQRPDSIIERHLFMVLRTFAHVLIWLVGLATGLNSIGFEVTAILAGLGIGGMALALASQDTVANIFGGVIILTQRPFKIGDRIEVDSVNGWVQKIGLRNTTVMNWYGRLVQIPNKRFTDGIVTNIDSQSCYYVECRLRIEPWTAPDLVQQGLSILRDIVAENDLLLKQPWAALDKVDLGYLEIEFWYAIAKWSPQEKDAIANEYEKICQAKTRVNLEILRRFQAAGIKLAIPMRLQMNVNEQDGGVTGIDSPD